MTIATLMRTNAEYTRATSVLIPYPIERVWPHLGDYAALQAFLHEDQHDATNFRLEPGPEGGVGATIAFDWGGGTVRETLVEHDEHTHRWKIIVPGQTSVFTRYSATVTFVPVGHETLAALEIKMALRAPESAGALCAIVDPLILQRLPKLVDWVHLCNGLHHLHLTAPVTVEAGELWNRIGRWDDVGWMHGALAVRIAVDDPARREIDFDGYTVSERLAAVDHERRSMTYELLTGSSLPVSTYRATLSVGDGVLEYDLLFTPAPGADAAEVEQALEARLRAGAAHITQRVPV